VDATIGFFGSLGCEATVCVLMVRTWVSFPSLRPNRQFEQTNPLRHVRHVLSIPELTGPGPPRAICFHRRNPAYKRLPHTFPPARPSVSSSSPLRRTTSPSTSHVSQSWAVQLTQKQNNNKIPVRHARGRAVSPTLGHRYLSTVPWHTGPWSVVWSVLAPSGTPRWKTDPVGITTLGQWCRWVFARAVSGSMCRRYRT
jgi:hypothetical protein